jgi:hypothetical protein
VATPWTFHSHRVHTPLRVAPGIEDEYPIGCTQSIDDLSDQHGDRRPMVPWRRPAALLHDQALDIDQGSTLIGLRVFQVRQQARQVAVGRTLTRLGLQTVLIGRNDVAQAVNQVANT